MLARDADMDGTTGSFRPMPSEPRPCLPAHRIHAQNLPSGNPKRASSSQSSTVRTAPISVLWLGHADALTPLVQIPAPGYAEMLEEENTAWGPPPRSAFSLLRKKGGK
ncbi:hypothetical protein BV25DRAFT_1818903 [Artomyces pyxidatus]|uniref:Uncharacterized protein n=1 Tax=Artomyces pyxidatus TaxID=48021 RepID=A0ACB8TGG4_9AGAM|nr:hypothetical protein BV25DRAFT_1818903 [Artomyces pyxidatus]